MNDMFLNLRLGGQHIATEAELAVFSSCHHENYSGLRTVMAIGSVILELADYFFLNLLSL